MRRHGRSIEVENCEVKLVEGTNDQGISFTRLDFALPFFPDEAKSILQWSPIRDDMNRYGLKVVGLPSGKYALHLDDAKVAEYSAEELAAGVNLAGPALGSGPVADQVKKVWSAIKAKNQYFHDQIYRGVVLANAKSPAFKDVDPKDVESRHRCLSPSECKRCPSWTRLYARRSS